MAENAVPSSFEDLKARAARKVQQGGSNVQQDIVEMGDAMLQAGVEPKSPQDHVAKRLWQTSQPHEKRMLADMVARMAAEDADEGRAQDEDDLS